MYEGVYERWSELEFGDVYFALPFGYCDRALSIPILCELVEINSTVNIFTLFADLVVDRQN